MGTPKRFIIEFGTGIDLHGMNQTKAANKAIKNAISSTTLVGLDEIVNFNPKDHHLILKIKIAAPNPEEIETEALRREISTADDMTFELVKGGMTEKLNDDDQADKEMTAVVVNCSVTVYVATRSEGDAK